VEELWSPVLTRSPKKSQAKAKAVFALDFSVSRHGGPFSLGRGLILGSLFLKLGIFLSLDDDFWP